ncbi:MAG: ABC transporter permease [Chloroflexi bacterium]|nr:ABC transporter permease [Chloroflexota bacterium]
MNMYWHELRANLRSLILWSVGIVSLIAAGMAKYAGFVSAGDSINALFAAMPPAIQAIAGSNRLDLSKASGFYGVCFLYIAVMATIHASMLGANSLAKEERDKTSEFLYTKPVSRTQVITSKLLAALTNIVILNLITWGSSLLLVGYFGQGEDVSRYIRTLMAGLFCIQLLYLSFGSVSAAFARKPAAAAGIATAIMMGTFLLSMLIDINSDLDVLKYLTPFKCYDAKLLLPPNGIEPVYLLLSAGLVVVSIVAAYLLYQRKDLAV